MSFRPFIFWGIDDCADTILDPLINIFKSRTRDAKIYSISGSNKQDPLKEFQDLLVDLKESLQAQHNLYYPQIIVCSLAFDAESEKNLEHLEKISNILRIILSSDQSIYLVIFFPPPVADPQEKAQTFKYFIRLEDLAWGIPFLNIVFVNQLSKELYLYTKKLHETLHKEDTVIKEIHDEAMYELLYRELVDDGFDETIQGVGFTAIRNQNVIEKRKCCYSTLGAYKLIYEPQVCMRYLETRLQYEMFSNVFMNEETILKDKIDRAGTFLDFSKGFIPLVEQKGIMVIKIKVRSDKIINQRLSSEYKYLFDENSEFQDNEDPNIVDFTRLIFGFPAFLIHGLCECRELLRRIPISTFGLIYNVIH